MIKYDKLWETMRKKGKSTYWLREKSGIGSKTIKRLKNNQNMETKTLNAICDSLDCKLSDIAEYSKD